MYVKEIYPILAQNDPEYQRALAAAGLGWQGRTVLGPANRRDFDQVMKLQATLGAAKILDARSLDPPTIRTKVIEGPTHLYRVSSSSSKWNPGIWWFTEKVAQRCRQEAGPDPIRRLEWLRNVLAVCFNWSSFDRIERLSLQGAERLPAVLGRGLPMPHYKVDPYIDKKTGERVVELPKDYWAKKGEILTGGELQIVLPWIPVRRVTFTQSL